MTTLNFTRASLVVLVVFCACGIMLQTQTSQVILEGLKNFGMSIQASQQQRQSNDLTQHTEIFRDHFHDKMTLNKSHVDIFIFSAFVTEHSSIDQYSSLFNAEDKVVGKSIAANKSKTRGNNKRRKATDREDNTTVRQEVHDVSMVFDVHINGWEHQEYKDRSVKCCYLWETGEVSESLIPSRNYYFKKSLGGDFLFSVHYRCLHFSRFMKLQGVHIQTHNNSCDTVKRRFIKPLSPHRPKYNGMIAVCLKVIFGEADPKWLIEWFEHYKELKVDKVFLTTYNVSESVHKVLQYYVAEGFVEAVPFDFPWKNKKQRQLGQKTRQVWDDEQVVVFDFSVRYKEYSFTSIIDLDEFLVPADGDLKTLMSRLMVTYPGVGVFTFNSTLMIKSWEKYPMYGTSVVSQFIQGTPSVLTRPKYVAISNRTVVGYRSTHACTVKTGNRRMVVPSELAVMYHYKSSCYNNLRHICDGARVNRTNILRIIERTDPRSLSVAKKLKLA